jgi:hypothetical protein
MSTDFACAWCERVRPGGAARWHASLPEDVRLSATTLGMCPDCVGDATGDALATGTVLTLAVFEG